MSDGTEAVEQEEMADETPLDEEVGDDEIIPESDEGQPGSADHEDYEEEQIEEIPAVEPQASDRVQQQIDALTQQNAQSMQYMQGLAQAMTQMVQQRPQGPAPAMAATAPDVDLDKMSSSELVRHVQSLMQAQYAQPMANMDRQVRNITFRSQQLGDALALLGKSNPDFQHVDAAFEMMNRVPNLSFKDAFKSVKGWHLAEQNKQLEKKQTQQVKATEKRRRKARGQSRRPDNRPKRQGQAKNVTEAMEQLEKEGFFNSQKTG